MNGKIDTQKSSDKKPKNMNKEFEKNIIEQDSIQTIA